LQSTKKQENSGTHSGFVDRAAYFRRAPAAKQKTFSKEIKMNKSELISAMAKDANITKAQAGAALESFVSNVTTTLKKGDKVSLVGFGTFSTSKRAARTGRNPQTGAEIQIAAKTLAKFKPGKGLSDELN
jgi:DNA-binding protein HU-beta